MTSDALGRILVAIRPLVQTEKYDVAGRTATDFIKTAYYLESKEDVFLGEVLETVYLQVGVELKTHKIPDEARERLTATLVKYLDTIITNHAEGIVTHDVLVNMRYDTTVFQFSIAKNISDPQFFRPEVDMIWLECQQKTNDLRLTRRVRLTGYNPLL